MADSKIRVLIDVVTDKASSSLKNFRQDLASSEGAMGKLRTTGSAAFTAVKAHALEFAAAGGAAIIGFAAKGVQAFQNLALEAGKFADATGIAVEDASRWIEVAGDLGVSSEAVQGSIQRMNKSIADGKLDEFADQIVRAKDGTVDANATFQRLVTTIGAIEDPTRRAQVAQQTFGRGYAEIAELMEMSATDLAAALGDVSEQKIIDDDEVAKARKFRASLDELKDKGEDLALSIGETLIPTLITLSDGLSKITGPIGKVKGAWDSLGQEIDDFRASVPGVEYWDRLLDSNLAGKYDLSMRGVAESLSVAADESRGMGHRTEELEAAMGAAERQALDLEAGIRQLQGALSKRDAFEAAVEGWNKVLWTATAATNAEAAGAENAAELRAQANEEIRRSIDATLEYIGTVGGIPKEQTTEIEALIDQGRYAEVESMLQQLARRRTATIEALGTYLGRERRAAGGPVSTGHSYLVGEKGPEIVTMGGNGYVTPNHALGRNGTSGGSATYSITVNAGMGTNGQQLGEAVVSAIRSFERTNGSSWRN